MAREAFTQADPDSLQDFYRALGIRIVYDPEARRGSSSIRLGSDGDGSVRVRGGTWTLPPLTHEWTVAA